MRNRAESAKDLVAKLTGRFFKTSSQKNVQETHGPSSERVRGKAYSGKRTGRRANHFSHIGAIRECALHKRSIPIHLAVHECFFIMFLGRTHSPHSPDNSLTSFHTVEKIQTEFSSIVDHPI
jgi:hypothetical protein